MRRLSFKSIPTARSPDWRNKPIKITKGFSISTTKSHRNSILPFSVPPSLVSFKKGILTLETGRIPPIYSALSHQMGREGCESPLVATPGIDCQHWMNGGMRHWQRNALYAGPIFADEVAWTSQNSMVLPVLSNDQTLGDSMT